MPDATDALTTRFQAALEAYGRADTDTARTIASELVAGAPTFAEAHNLLSVIAQDDGLLGEAEAAARTALEHDPGNPIYLNSLANTLRRLGRTDEAIDAFEKARRGLPDQPDILFNLGNALRDAGRFDEAVDAYRASIAIRPGAVPVHNNLAITLKAMGDPEGAATILIEGLAYAPKSPELRFNLGNALQAAGRYDAAESSYRRAIELRPDHADAWVNLGVVQAAQNNKGQAEESFREAIKIDPDVSQAYVGLADLADDGGLDAVAHRRKVLAMKPELAAIHSSLLMCLHYTSSVTVDELAQEHLAFGKQFEMEDGAGFAPDHDFSPDRPLRLGVVSGDFRFHAMLFFALPVFSARNRTEFHLTCYSTTAHPDAHTSRFRQAADQWRDVRTLSDADLCHLIVKDRIDVLIDLSGHAPHNRLLTLAMRPAPLQVAWGDYVDTRGLNAIDALIGDAVHTPMAEQARYVETLVHMPHDYICYRPPDYLPPASAAPSEKLGYVTFGTFSELTKIQPETVALWARVLEAVPDSRFFANGYLFADEVRQGRLLSMFADHGILASRVKIGAGGEHPDFLAQYSEVDIILDTVPYSGGLTTCEALAMGVPVLALKGDRFCGRHAAAHLAAAGFGDWVADSGDDLVALAVNLASQAGTLSALRRTVRKTTLASPLCDVQSFTTAFFNLVRTLWQARCAT